jgi:hypothetical protein
MGSAIRSGEKGIKYAAISQYAAKQTDKCQKAGMKFSFQVALNTLFLEHVLVMMFLVCQMACQTHLLTEMMNCNLHILRIAPHPALLSSDL